MDRISFCCTLNTIDRANMCMWFTLKKNTHVFCMSDVKHPTKLNVKALFLKMKTKLWYYISMYSLVFDNPWFI